MRRYISETPMMEMIGFDREEVVTMSGENPNSGYGDNDVKEEGLGWM